MFDATLDALLQVRQQRDEEQPDIEYYRKGVELRSLQNSEAWTILVDTLQSYADKAVSSLLSLAPGDPNVMTAHAAASALVQQAKLFKEDIEKSIQDSYEVPAAVRRMTE